MTALVTGAGGFLGSALVDALLARGERVVATYRRAPGSERPGLVWRRFRMERPAEDLPSLLTDVTSIYHLSWSTVPAEANADPVGDAEANIVGSLSLFQAAAKARPGLRVVFASSGGTVYGPLRNVPADETHPLRPISAYGVSKRAVEAYLDLFADLGSIVPVSLRIGNVFGPRQGTTRTFGAVAHFAARAARGEPITIFGDGSTERDYVYLDDAVDAFLRAGEPGRPAGTYNIGTGQGRSLLDIVAALEGSLGRRLMVEHRAARAVDVPVSVLDASLARRRLEWEPKVTFEDGVARTLAAWQLRAEPA